MEPACLHRLSPGGVAPEMECSVLLDALGVSPNEELSVNDVRRVFRKVLHVSVSPQDVEKAVGKVNGGATRGLVCGARKLLDVLAEIESERVASEELYWDFQMLNAGRLSTAEHLYAKDAKLSVGGVLPEMPWSSLLFHDQRQKNEETRNSKEDVLLGISGLQGERLKRRLYAWRLKKDVRRLCNRLSKAGLDVVLPSLCSSVAVPAVARGIKTGEMIPSKPDLFHDLEDKYDILQRKLCREMLQQHYGKGSWEALLPWQQEEREDALEALAEDALCVTDPLGLCELPGAFRLYRSSDQVVLRSCPEQVDSSITVWTAAISLKELRDSHQLEKKTLTSLAKSLDVTGLQLLSLYVKVAVMRARREEAFHVAMLAASQAWEKWPEVGVLRNKDLARFLLAEESSLTACRDASESPTCPREAVLQCLLLRQERERRCLLGILHSLTLEELMGQEGQNLAECTQSQLAALRKPCVSWLRDTRVTLEGASGLPSWGDSALCLLTHLMELQDQEVRVALGDLLRAENITVLREKYEAELEDHKFVSLHQLLLADPKTPADDSNCGASSTSKESKATEEDPAANVCEIKVSSPASQQPLGNNKGDQEDTLSVTSGRRDCTFALGNTDTPEVLYLDVLWTSANDTALEGDKMSSEEEETTFGCVPISLEKQGSLIAVAWSQTGQGTSISEVPLDIIAKSETDHRPEQLDTNADRDTNAAHEKSAQEASLNVVSFQDGLQDGCFQEPPVQHDIGGEFPAEAPVTLGAKAIQGAEDDFCPGAENRLKWSQPQDQPILDGHGEKVENFQQNPIKDATSNTETGAKCIRREMTVVHISEMEREETMKSLVDMQRKVESMYQRDKERQMLRFQERLSIVQSRKSDEDLLGHKQRDDLKHLTENLKKEDINRQKTLVKEKLDELRRERSYVLQSKRERNTAGFKELLAPVVIKTAEVERSHCLQ